MSAKQTSMAKVSITKVKNEDIESAVQVGLDSVGINLNDIKSVLIKPNFLNDLPAKTGVTTDIKVLEALIKILKAKGIENITIGEKSGFKDTDKVFEKLGVDALKSQGVKILNFDKDEYIEVNFPEASILKQFHLPKAALEADLIISVPKIKTHAATTVTINIKNLFGFLKTTERKRAHVLGLSESLVDLYHYLLKQNKKMISVVDGIYGLSGPLGPSIGKAIKMGLIVCGDNLLATDKVCTRLMRYNPEKVKHIVLAGKIDNSGKIRILGEEIEAVSRKFDMPNNLSKIFSALEERAFNKHPFVLNPQNCTGCKECMNACPVGAINVLEKGKIIFDNKKCIDCLCCVEMCKNGVLSHKYSFPISVICKLLRGE